MVEVVDRFGQIALSVFVLLDGAIHPIDGSFQIRQQYIDPGDALPGFVAVALATQLRIVNLHKAFELAWLLTSHHGPHDLVFEAPGRARGHP